MSTMGDLKFTTAGDYMMSSMKLKNVKTGEVVTLETKEEQERFFDNRNPQDWEYI